MCSDIIKQAISGGRVRTTFLKRQGCSTRAKRSVHTGPRIWQGNIAKQEMGGWKRTRTNRCINGMGLSPTCPGNAGELRECLR